MASVTGILRRYFPIVLAPFVLLAPVLLRGEALFWGTPGLQFVPWWWQAWQQLQEGVLPLWNPLSGMGAPLLANYQMAFFYPPNWLLLLCAAVGGAGGIAWGYTLLAALHLAWGGLGMALLIRRLGMRWLGQIIGGLAFALSGYVVGRLGFFSMTWVAAWLPWMVYFTERLLFVEKPRRFLFSPGLAACVAMQLLAGHAQLAWYSLLLAGVWFVVGWSRSSVKDARQTFTRLAAFAVSLLLGAVVAAVQLVPTFEYLRNSFRADAVQYGEAMRYSFWPWRFLSLFAPDFFGYPSRGDFWGTPSFWEDHAYTGMIPLALALATLLVLFKGLFARKSRTTLWKLVVFLWLLLVVTFVLALGENSPIFPFLYRYVPTFDMFQAPARYLIWFAFAVPLLAAVGVEYWRSPEKKGLYWFRLGTAAMFALTLGAGLTWLTQKDIQLSFIRATATTGVWALGFGLLTLVIPYAQKKNGLAAWSWVVIAWVAADLLAAGWGLNPGVPLAFYQTPTLNGEQVKAVVNGQRIYLGEREEYDLKFRRFLRFKDFRGMEDWRNLPATLLPNLYLLDGIASANNFDPLIPERYAHWIAALETKPSAERPRWLALMNVGAEEHIDAREATGVRFDPMEGGQAWRWYGCVRPVRDGETSWQVVQEMLANGETSPLVIEVGPDMPVGECNSTSLAEVRLVRERGDQTIIEINAPADGWLFASQVWYPGWQAELDSKPIPLYRANYLFQAAQIPAGSHRFILSYRPMGFYFGAILSILGLFILIIFPIRGKKKPLPETH